ncbi:MAG TPA: hypothetical protein VLG47_01225 [Candidatus Saccharimonadales bacterium]|nr:hypothetical protein [Candidatus Saccharimonadales bacterium]
MFRMLKNKKPEPTPKSYKYVLTHAKFYEYENSRWYFISSFALYLVALQTVGQYLLYHRSWNIVVQLVVFILFLWVVVFANDYIFYRIAKRKKH